MSDVKLVEVIGQVANQVNIENDGSLQPRRSRPRLSICVPTFERSVFLDYLLDTVIEQVGENSGSVQVVVSDNFSQDSTWEVVKKFQARAMNLRYLRNHRNLGVSANLNAAVQGSDGTFCWLLGDDDALRPGAIAFILELLKVHNPDVLISNRYSCDQNMTLLGAENFLPTVANARIFDFNSRDDLLAYFAGVRSTIGMFNFLSCLIIRRDSWMRAPEVAGYSNSIFPHVFKVVDILRNQRGRLLYVPEQTVFARTGNSRLEDISAGSSFKSWQLHFSGNIEVADHYFGDDHEAYDAFLGPIRGIVANAKEYYVALAQQDGFLEEAYLTLKKLDIDR